jgi:hypothetical protein
LEEVMNVTTILLETIWDKAIINIYLQIQSIRQVIIKNDNSNQNLKLLNKFK